MLRQITISAVLSLTMFIHAGAAVIDVGTHYLLPNDERRIPITVSGGDLVEGLNFYIQVADGGEINEGIATKPKITGLDIIGPGTLFNQSNTGSEPMHLPDSGGTYLIWKDSTTTAPGVHLNATGTLAFVTINTANTSSSDSPYSLNLDNVAANYFYPDEPFSTDFDSETPLPTIHPGQIIIVDLHDMHWNKSANGVWTEPTWTGSPPPYPNYTARAFVDSPYKVDVNDPQEANQLTISNGGQVALGPSGSLTITNSMTVDSNGMLSIAPGSGLTTTSIQLDHGKISGSGTIGAHVAINGNGGIFDAPLSTDALAFSSVVDGVGGLTKNGLGTVTLLANASYGGDTTITDGCLQLNGANSVLHAVTGGGSLSVGNGSTVTVDSISIDKLTIGAGSIVTIKPCVGGPLSSSGYLTPVPEPSAAIILVSGWLLIGLYTSIFPKIKRYL